MRILTLSGMHPGALLQSLRRDPSVKDQKLTKKTLLRILGFARPHRRVITAFLIFVAIDAMLVIVNPLLVRHLIDDGILHPNLSIVIWLAVLMALVSVFDAILGVTIGYLSAHIGEGLIFDLRKRVFGHIQRMPMAFFTRTQTGALVSRLNNDVIGAQRAFTSTLSNTLSNAVSVLVVGVAMLALSWQVTVACLALFPLLWVASKWVGRRISGVARKQMDANAQMGNMMTERFNVSGALLLKLFGRREDEDAAYAARAGEVRDLGIRIALITRVFVAAMMMIPALATALVYGLGGYLAIQNAITIGTLTALATLLLRLLGPLQGLSNVRVDVMTALVSFDRIFEVLDLPQTISDKPNAEPLPVGSSSVEFRAVHFGYPGAQEIRLESLESVSREELPDGSEVIKGLDFTVNAGEMVALVGPSGAGKTTITHLVARLYDVDSGAVLVGPPDDRRDVRDVQLESLEQTVGYVTQDAHLFHDSIRANLHYARPEATDREIWDALSAAQISKLVEQMPNGLDTVVGDRGYRLSGGERQRLAIARLLLKAPPIVVLDEATAHLDSESEYAVQQALDLALRGRTSIVIAHRLSTVRRADQILVVDDGRIVERGTHEQLLAARGVYADLYQTQFVSDASATPTGFWK